MSRKLGGIYKLFLFLRIYAVCIQGVGETAFAPYLGMEKRISGMGGFRKPAENFHADITGAFRGDDAVCLHIDVAVFIQHEFDPGMPVVKGQKPHVVGYARL